MRLFNHVPIKEINSPPKMRTAKMTTHTVLSPIKYQHLSTSLQMIFSHIKHEVMFYRNIHFLIKHIINHIVVKVERSVIHPGVTNVQIYGDNIQVI